MNRSNGILYYVNMDKMIIDVQIKMIKKGVTQIPSVAEVLRNDNSPVSFSESPSLLLRDDDISQI